jgi:hypothetical protein
MVREEQIVEAIPVVHMPKSRKNYMLYSLKERMVWSKGVATGGCR